MKQTNQRTKKMRSIRRAHGGEPREGGAAMAAMKRPAKSAMKPTKAKKRVSKVGTKVQVLAGKKEKTKWGLRKEHLLKSKGGKVVTKRKSAAGKKAFEQNLSKWILACSRARGELGLTGFVPVKRGTAFYNKTREYYTASVGS